MTLRHRQIPFLFLFLLIMPAAAAPGDGAPQAESAQARGELADYVLGPEDVIDVFVWKEPDLSTVATIRPDGRIALPLVGEIGGAGKTARQIQAEVTTKLKKFIDQPAVTVMVKEIHSPKISVLGEVKRPGRFLVPQRVTILDAIAMSGGFTEFADRDDVVILRPTESGVDKIPVDVKSLLRDGGTFYLEPQDTVYVH